MATKLWQAGSVSSLHPAVEAYTVGTDYLLDQKLLGYDIQASKAHVEMLQSVKLLSAGEAKKLLAGLEALHKEWQQGLFTVQKEQEDGHTAIEAYLTETLGDTGKKIHTARSRNDQALVMMRLYLKDRLQQVILQTESLVMAYKNAAKKAKNVPMPGYTHMQKAMPSTVSAWLSAYADGFADAKLLLEATMKVIDQNPLGSAAGFGSDLPIDRDFTTAALGFKKTQENPLYCGLSRGLFELMAVQALNPIVLLAGKFAQDMMLFTTQEFDFFSLPDSFTTGSSIMPHKHNYDLFEIMRGNAHSFGAYSQQLQAIVGGVGSGYHRDLQLSKKVTVEAFEVALETMSILCLVAPEIIVHEKQLIEAITGEMYSVAKINTLVNQGVSFRDAYAQVKSDLNNKNL